MNSIARGLFEAYCKAQGKDHRGELFILDHWLAVAHEALDYAQGIVGV